MLTLCTHRFRSCLQRLLARYPASHKTSEGCEDLQNSDPDNTYLCFTPFPNLEVCPCLSESSGKALPEIGLELAYWWRRFLRKQVPTKHN